MAEYMISGGNLLLANPVATLLLFVAAFGGLAYLGQIYPSRLAAMLLGLPVLGSLALFWKQDALPLIIALDGVTALVMFADLSSIPRRCSFAVQRDTPRIGSLRKPHRVALSLSNLSGRSQRIGVRDDIPSHFEPSRRFDRVELSPRSRATLEYTMRCTRRGAHWMDAVFVRASSKLGLWSRFLAYPLRNELHVYPDMQQLQEYALLARTNRLSLMGVRRRRRIGQDNEFERLRDFTRDDQYKHIDWRSTARRNKLTVRDFQTNQSQRVVFLVDCGRMMVNREGEWTLLDHALNATLMLAYVALRQGDAVGMLAFSDRIHAYVPPRGGGRQMNYLLHAAFDRFPELVESRYDLAFLHLSRKCRKRTLVVLITNLIDEVNAGQIESYLGALAGRHLPLCVMLRDRRLFAVADAPLDDPQAVYASAAAANILTWRHQVLNHMHHRGVLVLDTFPDELTAPLVNRYLEIKARHLL